MYTALYRQWRPDTFKDVVGQDTIIRTLVNQIKSGRIAHAYLFCGSRGTGKTSTAKIFARAINCETPTEYGPCGTCPTCEKLSFENNMDILEIDAASNNGVDEIRDLREKVKFLPNIGKYKVYIIDEVHMLSPGAFNALLKTLEEPPEHVVFILATTEPQKLPATILSRCQRYNFKRITTNVIVERMKTIVGSMQISVEEDALYTIARWAEGGMRDALSLLDQCIGLSGNTIGNDDVLSVLGTADQGFIFETASHIFKGDVKNLLQDIDTIIDDGKDIDVFIKVLINHLRDVLITKCCDKPERLLDVSASTIERFRKQAQEAGESRLVRALEILSSLEADIKYSTQPRVLVELAMIRICRPEDGQSMDALLDRVEALEKKLEKGVAGPKVYESDFQSSEKTSSENDKSKVYSDYISSNDVPVPYGDPPPADIDYGPDEDIYNLASVHSNVNVGNKNSKGNIDEVENIDPSPNNSIQDESMDRYPSDDLESSKEAMESTTKKDPVLAWPEVLSSIKKERMGLYSFLKDAKQRVKGNDLVLTFPETQGFFIAAVEKEENKSLISEIVERVTGHRLTIKCRIESKEDTDDTNKGVDYSEKKAIEIFGEDLEILDE